MSGLFLFLIILIDSHLDMRQNGLSMPNGPRWVSSIHEKNVKAVEIITIMPVDKNNFVNGDRIRNNGVILHHGNKDKKCSKKKGEN